MYYELYSYLFQWRDLTAVNMHCQIRMPDMNPCTCIISFVSPSFTNKSYFLVVAVEPVLPGCSNNTHHPTSLIKIFSPISVCAPKCLSVHMYSAHRCMKQAWNKFISIRHGTGYIQYILHWNVIPKSIGVAWNVGPYKLIRLPGHPNINLNLT